MIDIVSANDGQDLGILDTLTPKAGNILSIQVGALEYAQDLGIDLKYFLSEDFEFQNDSFRAYLIQVLANRGINVTAITESLNALYTDLGIQISGEQKTTALVAR